MTSPTLDSTSPSPIWCEVSASAPVEQAETVAEAMRTVAPGGVSIEDPLVPLGPEEGVRLDRRKPSVVKAYLPVDDGLGERLERLDAAFAALGVRPELTTRTVREEDWAGAWKEYFHVERFGERVVIRPSWRDHDPRPGDVVIDLDPGMAFGTGQHPTTRMCLELLEREIRSGMTVLDVGTGSGILAVAAVKLGAARVLAFDIEPGAVKVARENAGRNGVAGAIQLEVGTLDLPPRPPSLQGGGSTISTSIAVSSAASPQPLATERVGGIGSPAGARDHAANHGGEAPSDRVPSENAGPVAAGTIPHSGPFDLAVANITASAVAALVPAFAATLRPGALLIGSGIVDQRLDEVLVALTRARFTVEEVRSGGDWRAVVARAPVGPPGAMV